MRRTLETLLPLAILFATSCGAVEPDATPDDDTPPACDTLDEASCRDQTGCAPLRGRRYDAAGGCLEPESFIACWDADDTACNNAIAGTLEDPDGACWFQDAACGPTAWAGTSTCEDAEGAPACDE